MQQFILFHIFTLSPVVIYLARSAFHISMVQVCVATTAGNVLAAIAANSQVGFSISSQFVHHAGSAFRSSSILKSLTSCWAAAGTVMASNGNSSGYNSCCASTSAKNDTYRCCYLILLLLSVDG